MQNEQYQPRKARGAQILVPGSDKTGTHSNAPISEVSARNPTKQLAGNLMLVDVSLRQPGRGGKCGVIDFSIVTPAAESYCFEAAKTPLYAANLREEAKLLKYFQVYKLLDDIHFI